MISIQRGLSQEFSRSAAELFFTAFEDKFVPILGNRGRAIDLLESSFVLDNSISAVEDGRLLGVLAMQTERQGFIQLNFNHLRDHYGFGGGIIRAAKLALLQHTPDPSEMHIEGIAVADSARGKGIGTRLIDELISQAISQGCGTVTLQVVGTNQRALQLYERLGFRIEEHTRIWPINWIIGWPFDESIFMRRNLG